MNSSLTEAEEPSQVESAVVATTVRRKRSELSRRNLPLLMLMAREAVTSFFRPVFNEFKLTEQQWRITRALYEDGELMISQVAEKTFIVGPSLSGILQRMVEAGLLVKRLDPLDTRRFYVSLTKAGRGKFEAMVPRIREAYRELELRIGEDGVDEIYDLMDRLLVKIGRGLE